ncbi:ubiquitin-40S ribosomal protein S27a [Trichogramma pretiosum]|uniref:ubiquitin-40S ribosomal protein S27a n=1 Tax=Trichogramma pretiosum TaxID=7493 RepID=UPI0006C9A119|nr:ubiquitin-40S ribosomal protein S27a [Trichogramma pretiosum]XP_014235165.1 ubiquitin-40S ribosomal protein S27a [Trichogramma pretiosum]
MQIHIRGYKDETTIFEVEPTSTIGDIKARLQVEDNTDFNLYAANEVLTDETLVSDLGDKTTLEFVVGLLGGKVHGSLARAGKVKGQTPKVEKQEKRKKKTGRAKRRIQYNRRFVNVVQTFGRRRGPNANPNS